MGADSPVLWRFEGSLPAGSAPANGEFAPSYAAGFLRAFDAVPKTWSQYGALTPKPV